MTGPAQPGERLFLGWIAVNIAVTLAASSTALWSWSRVQEVQARLAQAQRLRATCEAVRVIRAGEPVLVDPEERAPPQDRIRPGVLADNGAEIGAAMRLRLEAVVGAARGAQQLRLGDHRVLPTGTVHVINLWGTWCAPCKAELRDFKAMFDRRARDWGERVRFVPVLLDQAEPITAYQRHASLMPPAPVKLADRSARQDLARALTEGAQKLYHGDLPVTLVLDCNRRVRWAKFERLGAQDFAELGRVLDGLRAQLDDPDPNGWCRREWPGNGRCEGAEASPEHHSLEDCGELRRARPVEAAEPVAAVEACPGSGVRNADGHCVAGLRSAATRDICGDGVCQRGSGEDERGCCVDCGCAAPLVCKPDVGGRPVCQARGLKGVAGGR